MIGAEPTLVLHGGGNVSLKARVTPRAGGPRDVLLIKGSGSDLAELTPADLPAVDLERLRELLALDALDDLAMVNELRVRMLDAAAPNPSIETVVHAVLPRRFVDHSHPDALLALTNVEGGADHVRAALGDDVAIVPYCFPGFELSKAVARALADHPGATAIVLMQHGLVTFADDAKASYDRHVELVSACESYLLAHGPTRNIAARGAARVARPESRAALVAPMLRGLLAEAPADDGRVRVAPVLEWRSEPALLELLDEPYVAEMAESGPLTTDHLIRTKARPLYVPEPAWDDADGLRAQLAGALEDYRARERAFVEAHVERIAEPGFRERALAADVDPRVAWLPGAGLFCFGATKRDARIAADIAEHTLRTKRASVTLGRPARLDDAHLFDMQFRPLQLAKLGAPRTRALEGQVVVISGAAGAIGAGIADACADAGAHVVLADLNADSLASLVADIDARHGAGRALGLVMDVTDEASVRDGFDQIARSYGGFDVLVPNAGIAHVSPLADLELEAFRRVLDVNLVGYMLFMREGVRVLRSQGIGGNIVVQASKNVFGPGKDFGAYSASKAGGHQLGKVAAIELAPEGIRVNMINADAVFGDARTPSGLWNEVGPDRARRRNLKTEDLPDYYRERNLLKARVLARHVGNAVVFFASNATPTTGATLPVDGGVVEAFPR